MAATTHESAANTPSKIQFFKKGSGGFDYLKTAALAGRRAELIRLT